MTCPSFSVPGLYKCMSAFIKISRRILLFCALSKLLCNQICSCMAGKHCPKTRLYRLDLKSENACTFCLYSLLPLIYSCTRNTSVASGRRVGGTGLPRLRLIMPCQISALYRSCFFVAYSIISRVVLMNCAGFLSLDSLYTNPLSPSSAPMKHEVFTGGWQCMFPLRLQPP